MGIMGKSFMKYAQPLLDETDGSIENMNKALSLAQLCWNLALLPEDKREETISAMRPNLGMENAEFDDLRHSVVLPMIQQHHEMFPSMTRGGSASASKAMETLKASTTPTHRAQEFPKTGRNAPCPCGSGKKYKQCSLCL